MEHRLLLAVSLLGACAFVALGSATLAAPSTDPEDKILAGVSKAVEHGEYARVIVSFEQPDVVGGDTGDRTALRVATAVRQHLALAAVRPADFLPVRRYGTVPAIAGYVSSKGLESLAASSAVTQIALDGIGYPALGESVPMIHADDVRNVGVTGEGAVVAVLDSGVDTDHPDLAGDILYEACYQSGATCPAGEHPAEDDAGHGTMVAGIITGDGTVAPIGVAPDARIAAYKVMGPGYGFFSDWIAALDDIIANHSEVDIVNMSLASQTPCPLEALSTSISTLRDLGVPTFIAAGNWGNKNELMLPACVPEAISVGAVYDFTEPAAGIFADNVPPWSSSDDSLDLLAPGSAIVAAAPDRGLAVGFGTSFAVAHASGVAALLLQTSPELSADEVEAALENGGALVTDDLADADAETNRITPRIDARVALLDDADGDGCSRVEEEQTAPGSQMFGGRRDPNNVWDFFDMPNATNVRNGVIAGTEIFGMLARFGATGNAGVDPLSQPPPAPAYHPAFDRGPSSGPYAWNLSAADGSIAGTDLFSLLVQFGHACA